MNEEDRRSDNMTITDEAPANADVIEYGGLRTDRVRHRAFEAGYELHLTLTEFRLLECLLDEPGRTFTRDELRQAVPSGRAVKYPRTVDFHVRQLRKKLASPEVIETVRRGGYRLRPTGRQDG